MFVGFFKTVKIPDISEASRGSFVLENTDAGGCFVTLKLSRESVDGRYKQCYAVAYVRLRFQKRYNVDGRSKILFTPYKKNSCL